jgi:hypothetical protein
MQQNFSQKNNICTQMTIIVKPVKGAKTGKKYQMKTFSKQNGRNIKFYWQNRVKRAFIYAKFGIVSKRLPWKLYAHLCFLIKKLEKHLFWLL